MKLSKLRGFKVSKGPEPEPEFTHDTAPGNAAADHHYLKVQEEILRIGNIDRGTHPNTGDLRQEQFLTETKAPGNRGLRTMLSILPIHARAGAGTRKEQE